MTCVWFLGFCLVSLGGRWGQIVLLLLVVVVMTKVWKGILLVGIFLVVFPSIQGSALFAERSVTFCGDESAKQLYMSLVGLVNHSYPLFQTEGWLSVVFLRLLFPPMFFSPCDFFFFRNKRNSSWWECFFSFSVGRFRVRTESMCSS